MPDGNWTEQVQLYRIKYRARRNCRAGTGVEIITIFTAQSSATTDAPAKSVIQSEGSLMNRQALATYLPTARASVVPLKSVSPAVDRRKAIMNGATGLSSCLRCKPDAHLTGAVTDSNSCQRSLLSSSLKRRARLA